MTGTYVPTTEWLLHDWHTACIEAGGLCIQRCTRCGTWRHPPRRYCARCHSVESSFEGVTGQGNVISLAVSHRALDPGWAAEVPFATLVVELDEGPRLLAATSIEPGQVSIGDRVRCTIEARSDDFVLVWAEAAPTA